MMTHTGKNRIGRSIKRLLHGKAGLAALKGFLSSLPDCRFTTERSMGSNGKQKSEENDKYGLQRFIEAQNSYGIYDIAVDELERGHKRSHWVWFVFPQMKGLGYSYKSNYYGIACREEARAYLECDILNERLRKVCRILLEQVRKGNSVRELLGEIDALKVRSCLTLFDAVSPNDIFSECLDVCYQGERDSSKLFL